MYKKILVSNRAGIGDVILTIPVLRALKEQFPTSKLTFMISPNCLEIVKDLDCIDEIITYDKKQDSTWSVIKRIWQYDIALCLDFKYRTAVMAFFAGIPIRAGLKHKRKLFMTHAVDKNDQWENTYEPCNYANVIKESTGIELTGDLSELHLPPVATADVEYVDQLLSKHGIRKDMPLITIAPFTSWLPKNWPLDYYRKLIDSLIAQYPHQIVLVGTPYDEEKLGPLSSSSRVTNIMGDTSLLQMAEIIDRSQLFIGGCSAPLHVAAAKHTPFVTFYGATSQQRWAPRTKGIILDRALSCSPCNGPMIGCEEKPCMYEISEAEAFAACQKMLG